MYGRPTWTDCDEAGDYVVPNVFSPRDLVFSPDNMDETVPHTQSQGGTELCTYCPFANIFNVHKYFEAINRNLEDKFL